MADLKVPSGAKSVPDDLIEQVARKAGPKAVFGDPITAGDITLIPVVTVSYGGGGGGGYGGAEDAGEQKTAEGETAGWGEGSGYGFGVSARPVGTIEITPAGSTFEPVVDWTKIASIWSWISGIALLLLVIRLLVGGRD